MDRITPEIWIGSSADAKDRDSLRREGIHSILCLDGCLAGMKADELGVNQIEVLELVDGRGNKREVFLHAVTLLKKLKVKHSPVLVQCPAGQSRSAAVVCKYFMKEEGASLGQAMKRITSKRKVVIVAGLQEALDF